MQKSSYMYIYKNNEIIENGDLESDVFTYATQIEFDDILKKRTFINTDLYSVVLGDNIKNYPDFDVVGLDNELLRAIYKKKLKEKDWDISMAYTDGNGKITCLKCQKEFSNSSSMHNFYIQLSKSIGIKYFPVLPINYIQEKKNDEITLSPSLKSIGEYNNMIVIWGINDKNVFQNKYYEYYGGEMKRLFDPAKNNDEFIFMLSPTIYNITALEDEKINTVVISIETYDHRSKANTSGLEILQGL